MNIQLDLILPPILVGILIVLIIRIQSGMLSNQVESRLFYELQSKANSSILTLQQEFRNLDELVSVTDSTIRFLTIDRDTVQIFQTNKNLTISRINSIDASEEIQSIPLQLGSIRYSWVDPSNGIIRVSVETQSDPEDEVGVRERRYRAFAEKDFYLKNLTL